MLHWILESRPADATEDSALAIDHRWIRTLHVPADSRGAPLGITFDAIEERLMAHPGVHCEPDGSFAWTEWKREAKAPIRITGQLTDGGEFLQYAEIWGVPTSDMLENLLQWTVTRSRPVMIQLLRAGVFVEVDTFRHWIDPSADGR